MNKQEKKPSRVALSFFLWFCKKEFREEIEGDLMERFNIAAQKYSPLKSNLLFVKDVIFLLRPSLIGDAHQLINIDAMYIGKQNKRLFSIFTVAGSLLLVPFIAMKLTNEVNWKILDFLVAGFLLFGTGILLEFILRKINSKKYKLILIIGLFLLLILIWAELAVGVFGSVIAGS